MTPLTDFTNLEVALGAFAMGYYVVSMLIMWLLGRHLFGERKKGGAR